MYKDKFNKRFKELKEEIMQLPVTRSSYDSSGYYKSGGWQKWAISSQNLIKAVFGEYSPHYTAFCSSIDKCYGNADEIEALHGIFSSAKEDFEGGYVFDVDLKISGEIFGDFVAMAKHALTEGHKDVAAVLACSSLEDTLKKYAELNGLDTEEENMTNVINASKSKGLVSGAQKSLLKTMPNIRNFAMHAKWDKISAPDVSSVIGFVEQFLLTHFDNH